MCDMHGDSLLHVAVKQQKLSSLNCLLSVNRQALNVNVLNANGQTPLTLAVTDGYLRGVELLLSCDGLDMLHHYPLLTIAIRQRHQSIALRLMNDRRPFINGSGLYLHQHALASQQFEVFEAQVRKRLDLCIRQKIRWRHELDLTVDMPAEAAEQCLDVLIRCGIDLACGVKIGGWLGQALTQRSTYNRSLYALHLIPMDDELYPVDELLAKNFKEMPVGLTRLGRNYLRAAIAGDERALRMLDACPPGILLAWFHNNCDPRVMRLPLLLADLRFRTVNAGARSMMINSALEMQLENRVQSALALYADYSRYKSMTAWLDWVIKKTPEAFLFHETYKKIKMILEEYQAYLKKSNSGYDFSRFDMLLCDDPPAPAWQPTFFSPDISDDHCPDCSTSYSRPDPFVVSDDEIDSYAMLP